MSMFTMGDLLFGEEERVQDRGGNNAELRQFEERLRSAFGVEGQISRQVINY